MRKPTMWFLTRSDTNQAVQLLEMARGSKFCIKEVEVLYFPSSENKGADQLGGYREADRGNCVLVFAYAKRWFSHDAAHLLFQLDILWTAIITTMTLCHAEHKHETCSNK